MLRRPALTLCRDGIKHGQVPRRPISCIVRHARPLPERPLLRTTPRTLLAHGRAQQRRNAGSFVENAKSLWREYPFSVSLAAVIIVFGMGTIVYVNYLYQTYIIAAFHNYPEEVGM